VRTVTFAGVQLGDELLAVRSEPERLTRQEEPLLWSDVAHLVEDSANWLWRVTVMVLAVKTDELALEDYVASLVASLRGRSGDLVVLEDGQPARTYPACRLDAVERSTVRDAGRANFDASLTFRFTTTTDPVSS